MSKTEQNIEIAKLAVELMALMQSAKTPHAYAGINDELNTYTPQLVDVFDALYERLKGQLTED